MAKTNKNVGKGSVSGNSGSAKSGSKIQSYIEQQRAIGAPGFRNLSGINRTQRAGSSVMSRTNFVKGAGLVGAGVIGAAIGASGITEATPLGEFSSIDNRSFVHEIGKFQIKLQVRDGKLRRIRMAHKADPSKDILASKEDGKFLAAVQSDAQITDPYNSSIFSIDETIIKVCNEQSIDHVSLQLNKMTIAGMLSGASDQVGYTLTFEEKGEMQIGFSVSFDPLRPEFNHIHFSFETEPDERFFGFGEQTGYLSPDPANPAATLDMAGHEIPVLVSEQGTFRGKYPESQLINILQDTEHMRDIFRAYDIPLEYLPPAPYEILPQFARGVVGEFYTTNASMPYFLTNKKRGMFLENHELSKFDFTQSRNMRMGEDGEEMPCGYSTIKLWSPKMKGRIIFGNSPLDILKEYTEYAGRMEPLPDWMNQGAVLLLMRTSTYPNPYNPNDPASEKIYKVISDLLLRGTPIAAVEFEDWAGPQITNGVLPNEAYTWALKGDLYPDWDSLSGFLTSYGIKPWIYFNPMLVNDPLGGSCLYADAMENGYLVTVPDGEGGEKIFEFVLTEGGPSLALVDLINPNAYTWLKGVIKNAVLATGAYGWMADFAEAYPFDAISDYGNPYSKHNEFPEIWAKLHREIVDELYAMDGIKRVFYSRSAFTKSPGISTLFWTGDQLSSWDEYDGIKSAVRMLLSSGLSGMSLNHIDIGGYTNILFPIAPELASLIGLLKSIGILPPELMIPETIMHVRSRELLERWTELSAFTAVFRSHEGSIAGANSQVYEHYTGQGICDAYGLPSCPLPPVFSDDYTHFSKFAKVYAALAPYRVKLMAEAKLNGYPLARHMMLQYPGDKNVYDIDLQWMLGSEFLFAPVLDEGAESVDVYLPAGDWVHAWSGEEFYSDGEWFNVPATIGTPALFYKLESKDGEMFIAALREMGILNY